MVPGRICRVSGACAQVAGARLWRSSSLRNRQRKKNGQRTNFRLFSKYPKLPLREHKGSQSRDTIRWIEDGLANNPSMTKLNGSLLTVRGRSIILWKKSQKSGQMKNKTFWKFPKTCRGVCLGWGWTNKWADYHTNPNAPNRLRSSFRRENKTVLSNFWASSFFAFLQKFLSSSCHNRSSWAGPKLNLSKTLTDLVANLYTKPQLMPSRFLIKRNFWVKSEKKRTFFDCSLFLYNEGIGAEARHTARVKHQDSQYQDSLETLSWIALGIDSCRSRGGD